MFLILSNMPEKQINFVKATGILKPYLLSKICKTTFQICLKTVLRILRIMAGDESLHQCSTQSHWLHKKSPLTKR